MQFKLWFYENLAGPGDGPDSQPFDLAKMYLANKGSAGALPQVGNYPFKTGGTSPTAKYLDPSHRRKPMKRK
jgi:hypothetical protein